MSNTPSASTVPDPAASQRRIRARGRSYLALILSPEAPLDSWLQALDAQLARSPDFFRSRPLILDLELITPDAAGLAELQEALRQRGLNIIGIEGGQRDWPALKGWDWPSRLNGGRATGPVALPEEPAPAPLASSGETLVVEGPVRSGRSIENPDGDLIILGAVSSGAEVVAAGSIHVYGPLRGRAIAGIAGNAQACIYTTRLEAELLALNGYYMVSEELTADWIGQPARIQLQDDQLILHPLDAERR
ncbi:septum site-determining protein MinC [Oecophyllibacter saccharovorans]|uniref:septum site-determining protein MinC n=1 Tax=Oecophyllibacter saccharovorans TaxID=2558360 RepID=UPI00116DF0A1|nr:septum site-determining protein MinC [Oecophyllibacter saccharovorans]TPW35024.1 septum formation inhibitor MinC [Oecophyllibacter saccharovorans]